MFENENFIKHPVTVQLYWQYQYYVTHKVHLYYLHLFYEWEMASKSLWSAELSGSDALPQISVKFCLLFVAGKEKKFPQKAGKCKTVDTRIFFSSASHCWHQQDQCHHLGAYFKSVFNLMPYRERARFSFSDSFTKRYYYPLTTNN